MKKIIFTIITCVTIISCDREEPQLDRTIFIPDDTNPSLPAYSEWGYNVFGAKYERTYFMANERIIPCKIMYRNDSVYFLMQGVVGDDYPQQKMALTFIFPSEELVDYNDLIMLNKKVIPLNADCTVKMTVDNNEKTLSITKGELNFKRAQLLSIDDVVNRVILSGTFDFQFLTTSVFPESFSYGRFDLAITENEFYNNVN